MTGSRDAASPPPSSAGAPRPPAVAGAFYPADADRCAAEVERCLAVAAPDPFPGRRAVGAVAPHAGWAFSGPTLARALRPLVAAAPDLVILFGADHHGRDGRNARLGEASTWTTPLGPVAVDLEVARTLAGRGAARPSRAAHAPEHSLEVLLPFLQRLLPEARILPLLVPPGCGAREVGEAAVRAALEHGRRPVVVGSTDLTHYGARYGCTPAGRGRAARDWSYANDRDIIARILALDPEGVEASFRRRRNACGPGAAAAAVAAARELGAGEGLLVEHLTSADVTGELEPDLWVGYAAILLAI